MKAALLIEPGLVEIHEIEVPRIKPSDILIEVKSCGVCATDVKKYTGDSKTPNLPFILGHEPAGLISRSRVRSKSFFKTRNACGSGTRDFMWSMLLLPEWLSFFSGNGDVFKL